MISPRTERERETCLMYKHYNSTFFGATGDRFPVEKSYWERPLHRGEDKRRVELGLCDMTVYPARW